MRDDLDIEGNLPDRVRLEVRGPSGSLTRDNLAAVAVVLDLSDAQRRRAHLQHPRPQSQSAHRRGLLSRRSFAAHSAF